MSIIGTIEQLDNMIGMGMTNAAESDMSPEIESTFFTFLSGTAALMSGDHEEAVAILAPIVRESPGFVAARLNLAYALRGLGALEDALHLLDGALPHALFDPNVHMLKGDIYNNLQQHEHALGQFYLAIEDYQDAYHPMVTYNLGVTLLYLDRYREARVWLERSVSSTEAFLTKTGRADLEIHDNLYKANLVLGQICEKQNDLEAAAKYYRNCLSAKPHDPDLLSLLERVEIFGYPDTSPDLAESTASDENVFRCYAIDNSRNKQCNALIAIDVGNGPACFRCEYCRSLYFVDPVREDERSAEKSITVLETGEHRVEIFTASEIQGIDSTNSAYRRLIRRKTGGEGYYSALVLGPRIATNDALRFRPSTGAIIPESRLFEEIADYLETQDRFPGDVFMPKFYRLFLDEQIVLLQDFISRLPNDARAWKLLGYCYFWMTVDEFLNDAITSLTTSLRVGDRQTISDAMMECIASCYLLMGERKRAEKWFSKSKRFNMQYVLEYSYGSLESYAANIRFGNSGVRFMGYSTGRYEVTDLHLRYPRSVGLAAKLASVTRLFGA